jgi:hypothetical protein
MNHILEWWSPDLHLPTHHNAHSNRAANGLSGDSAAHSGQILVRFAFFLVVMLGAVGLSVDLALALSQRRAGQAGSGYRSRNRIQPSSYR